MFTPPAPAQISLTHSQSIKRQRQNMAMTRINQKNANEIIKFLIKV